MRNEHPLELATKHRHLWLVTEPARKPQPASHGVPPPRRERKARATKKPTPDNEVENLAENLRRAIKRYKKHHGVSADKDVAAACGVSPSQLSNWTKKKPIKLGAISWWTLKQVARGLGVSLDDLVAEE